MSIVQSVCLAGIVGLTIGALADPMFALKAVILLFILPPVTLLLGVIGLSASRLAPGVTPWRTIPWIAGLLLMFLATAGLHHRLVQTSLHRGDRLMLSVALFVEEHGRCPAAVNELPGRPSLKTNLLGAQFAYHVESRAPAPRCYLSLGGHLRTQDSGWRYNVV